MLLARFQGSFIAVPYARLVCRLLARHISKLYSRHCFLLFAMPYARLLASLFGNLLN